MPIIGHKWYLNNFIQWNFPLHELSRADGDPNWRSQEMELTAILSQCSYYIRSQTLQNSRGYLSNSNNLSVDFFRDSFLFPFEKHFQFFKLRRKISWNCEMLSNKSIWSFCQSGKYQFKWFKRNFDSFLMYNYEEISVQKSFPRRNITLPLLCFPASVDVKIRGGFNRTVNIRISYHVTWKVTLLFITNIRQLTALKFWANWAI